MENTLYSNGRHQSVSIIGKPSARNDGRRSILTIKVGAITTWVRDILAIALMWKILSII